MSAVLAFFLALPFIEVTISVQSPGTFQSALQRNPLIISVGGRLENWNLSENQKVYKGEVLATIRGELLHLEMRGIKERLNLVEDFIKDLNHLLSLDFANSSFEPVTTRSKFYQSSLMEFQSRIFNQAAALQKLERDFQRAQVLYDSQSIAFAEYDEKEAAYKQAKAQLELILNQRINEWEQELFTYKNEQLSLSNQLEVAEEQLDQYKVIAGTAGTLINVLNLNIGDFVYPQQKLAEISPDTLLLAVTYIPPSDIAFIEVGQEVGFQVDAYNYNQWGIAKGMVVEIADDLTLLNEKNAGFLVTCELDNPCLNLPSGQEGPIKKGMTFNARFLVAKRTLFQLLYDKVDDWINPFVKDKP